MQEQDKSVSLSFSDSLQNLFGNYDENLKTIERAFDISITLRGDKIILKGEAEDVSKVEKILNHLASLLAHGRKVSREDVRSAIRIVSEDTEVNLEEVFSDSIQIPSRKGFVTPKSLTQKEYIEAIQHYDIVFGIGPAGTGKTYLAMAMGIYFLQNKTFHRIVLTRPAVEAGEKLGFLPGDLYEKVNPYLRPLYDALHEMMDIEKAQRLLERGTIEVAPLAFMRGRTLNDSFVILDEAQNTTSEQMKMFLTRLGFSSKAVITGDITQTDLPEDKVSGLKEAQMILNNVEGIKFIHFTEKDVVRHPLVQKIITAYENYEKASGPKASKRNHLIRIGDSNGNSASQSSEDEESQPAPVKTNCP